MQEEPLIGNQATDTKIFKVSKKSNNQKVIVPSNSRLMIQNKEAVSEDQEIEEDLSNSNQRPLRPKTRNTTKTVEDYVELPKINFLKEVGEARSRKNSEVNIDLRVAEESSNINPRSRQNIQNSQESEEKQSQNGQEYASWNIHNINIIPSNNNYLQEEEYEVISGPTTQHSKEVSLTQSPEAEYPKDKKKSQKDRSEERKIVKQRERRQRERNIEIVSEFLSGKASVIWLFILNSSVQEESLTEIKNIYKGHIENDYEVPICRSYEDSLKFLKIQSCFFKVVADIQSSQILIKESANHKNIISIYIYNPRKQAGINKSFELKRTTKKIKGMFMDLAEAAKQAGEEIENEARFIEVDNQLEKERTKLRFPSFLILSGHDTTEVTAYRLCLYGALKLKEKKEKMNYLKEFTDMVEMRYAEVPKELANLEEYKMIDHLEENNQKKSREVLNFYVRQSFYYALTNSILRLSHSAEEFRPCTIPFNQTYHAIKHYYMKFRAESGGKMKKIITYRGAKLRSNDAKAIQVGSYIELLGFTSTSLKRSEAEKFMDNDSYLFEIIIQNSAADDSELQYDHGYVEMNRYGLANQAYKNEEEILFNALNVFKVISLDLTSAIRKITLKYGAALDLLRAKASDLPPHERAVISNYQFCINKFNKIEDDGDVLLLAQEHDRCIQYYQGRIDEGEKNYKLYGKIANAQLENGDLQEAYNNALRCLEDLNQQPVRNLAEVKGNYSKFERNKEIFEAKQDFIHFHATIDKYLKILGDDWFSKAKLLKQRGEKRLQTGDIEKSHLDLQKSKQILKEKEESFDKRRKQIKKRYMFRSFCCMCSRSATMQLEQQRELELLKIEADEVNFQHRKDQVHELHLEIENLLKQIAEKSGDKELYIESQEEAKIHFAQMSKTNPTQSPLLVAKYLVMEASLMENSSNNSEQFDNLMESAIEHTKKQNPYHQNLGVYHRILGTKRYARIKKRLMLDPLTRERSDDGIVINNLSGQLQNNYLKLKSDENSFLPLPETARYNYEKHNQLYEKSKGSFCEAAENIAYNKGSEHPDYLSVRNDITQLDFDFSRLKESQETALQTAQLKLSNSHSQGAKCYLMLAKISLAKGQLKKSFKNIEKAYEILSNSLVKVQDKKYTNVLMNHPYYMEIGLLKVKIFNRQQKHDLALKELKIIKKIAKLKIENQHSRILLATIYEENAEILICMGETVSFESYITRAIDIRSEEMGKFNIPNAVCYANLYKHMMALQDSEDATSYHHQATEIFSRFPSDHPSAWIIHLSNGLFFYEKRSTEEFINEMDYCIKVATKRYSPNHISILKIMFQYGKLLIGLEEYNRALNIFLKLETQLEESLSLSLKDGKIEKETDDEKIPLRKNLYVELKSIYSRSKNETDGGSLSELKRCQEKLKDYQHLATSSDKLLKSSRQIK